MEISTSRMLQILHVLAWIIFIGVSLDAGILIVSVLITWLVDPAHAGKYWREVDLMALRQFDPGYFFVESFFMCIVAILKGFLFYQILGILHDKKLDMAQPFRTETGRFIFIMSYVTLLIGIFSVWGKKYAAWLVTSGIPMPSLEALRLDGGDVWLFMSVTLFVLAHIFKRGIEIQNENDLTV